MWATTSKTVVHGNELAELDNRLEGIQQYLQMRKPHHLVDFGNRNATPNNAVVAPKINERRRRLYFRAPSNIEDGYLVISISLLIVNSYRKNLRKPFRKNFHFVGKPMFQRERLKFYGISVHSRVLHLKVETTVYKHEHGYPLKILEMCQISMVLACSRPWYNLACHSCLCLLPRGPWYRPWNHRTIYTQPRYPGVLVASSTRTGHNDGQQNILWRSSLDDTSTKVPRCTDSLQPNARWIYGHLTLWKQLHGRHDCMRKAVVVSRLRKSFRVVFKLNWGKHYKHKWHERNKQTARQFRMASVQRCVLRAFRAVVRNLIQADRKSQ